MSLVVRKGPSTARSNICMVGSCALKEPAYNRPGELLHLEVGQEGVACRILDGHAQKERANVLMRCTVTNVEYESHYDTFASVGFDGQVSFWTSHTGEHVSSLQIKPLSKINCLAISTHSPVLVAGAQSGHLHVARYSFDGLCRSVRADPEKSDKMINYISKVSLTRKKKSHEYSNSVDLVAFDNVHRNLLYGLVGFQDEKGGGQIYSLDLEAQCFTQSIYSASSGLSCIDVHPREALIALGTGVIVDEHPRLGAFLLLDPRNPKDSLQRIHTGQGDMDRILFR